MDKRILHAQRDYWDRVWADRRDYRPTALHWLDALAHHTPLHLGGNVLEIGCGQGADTRYLLAAGCRVTCMDLSWSALQQVRRLSQPVACVNAALPAPLPFGRGTFDCVVAGLSLHYFDRQDTCRIVQEIGRVLIPGGQFIFRVNSCDDVAHGMGRGEEIEPGLFLYEGRTKRFYTEPMCRDLFDATQGDVIWALDALIPWVETRSRAPKPTWMGVVHAA